jgi:glycerophosphoryl diester phosphodiesterase
MELIGHRGARFEAPENTLAGFRYALGIGVDAFELDVHLTADDELVVIHDDTLDRTTNGSGRVTELTLAEIQVFDARADFPDWPERCVVPTLGQVLGVIGGVRYLEIEVKTDLPERLERVIPRVVEAIHAVDAADRFTITSFDMHALRLAQSEARGIKRGLIGAWDDPRFRDLAIELAVSTVGVPYATADPALVAWANDAGLRTVGWPTNSHEQFAAAVRLDVAAVCTDRPSWLRPLLETRRYELATA